MDTLDTIRQLAATQFGREADTIDVNAQVDTLGIDSLGFMEFLFEVEDKVGVAIPQEAIAQVRTLRELAAVVDRLKSEQAAGAPAPSPSLPTSG